jgi:hypothetical protein
MPFWKVAIDCNTVREKKRESFATNMGGYVLAGVSVISFLYCHFLLVFKQGYAWQCHLKYNAIDSNYIN